MIWEVLQKSTWPSIISSNKIWKMLGCNSLWKYREAAKLTWLLVWKWKHSVVFDSLRPHGLYSPWNSPGQNPGVSSCSLLQGIFQTQGSNSSLLHCGRILYQLSHQGSPRILEWVAYPFSRGTSQPWELNRILLHFRWILYQLSHLEMN